MNEERVSFTVRFSRQNYQRLRALARARDVSMRQVLEQAFRGHCEDLEDDERIVVEVLLKRSE